MSRVEFEVRNSSATLELRSLNILRGLLAAYVIVCHSRWLLWSGHGPWLESNPAWWELPFGYASALFRFGHEAVMVFFVLSGFFIHLKAAANTEQSFLVRFDAGKFYQRRLHRLLAPYVVALLLTICLDAVGMNWFPSLYFAETGDGLIDSNFERMGYSYESILPALACLPNSLGKSFGTNGPLWSLAYEVCYYATYPVFLRIRSFHSGFAFLVVPLIAIAQQWFLPAGFPNSVLAHYPVWIAGAIFAELFVKSEWVEAKWRLAFGLILLGGSMHFATPDLAVLQIDAVCYSVGMVWLFASCGRFIAHWRISQVFEWFGVRSYSLYIIHFPVVVLISAIVFSNWGARPNSGWFVVLGTFLSIGIGCLAFQLCEKKFLHARTEIGQLTVPSDTKSTGS